MLRKSLLTFGLVAATALAVPALAQNRAQDGASGADSNMTRGPSADGKPGARSWREDARQDGRRGPDRRRSGHHMGGKMMMGMLTTPFDADGDGVVTQDEMTAGLAALVEKHDADGDGALSLDEFAALYAEVTRPIAVRAFQFVDADGDGQISPDERSRAEKRLINRFPASAPEAAE